MKKIRNLIFVLLLFGSFFIVRAGFCSDKTVGEQDGIDWQGLGNAQVNAQITFIMGFIMNPNTRAIPAFQVFEGLIENDTEVNSNIKTMWKILKENITDLDVSGITVGQIRDGVDSFYKDFANRKIKIVDAIYVVKMQIQGKDPDSINAQIRYLKMQPVSEKEQDEALKKAAEYREKIGKDDNELLLKAGCFTDSEGHQHLLFCYGRYE